MNDNQPWKFTCKTCGNHKLIVTRIWIILAGPVSERWQEWGPLEADHQGHYEFVSVTYAVDELRKLAYARHKRDR